MVTDYLLSLCSKKINSGKRKKLNRTLSSGRLGSNNKKREKRRSSQMKYIRIRAKPRRNHQKRMTRYIFIMKI